jgi:hypothetical protein
MHPGGDNSGQGMKGGKQDDGRCVSWHTETRPHPMPDPSDQKLKKTRRVSCMAALPN